MATVKGQATLDAANKRNAAATNKKIAANEEAAQPSALTTVSATAEKPKTLRQLEHIVESNALRGGQLWRTAADALMVIKDKKLWRSAVDPETKKAYPSFVVYAEERFGFKKTYAYDLVKAAQRKPDALTERSAREEMADERPVKPLNRGDAMTKIEKAWDAFESKAGDLRDRAIDDEDFVSAFDLVLAGMRSRLYDFFHDHAIISGEAEEVETTGAAQLAHDAEEAANL